MSKLLMILMLSGTAMACDGTCQCGGKPVRNSTYTAMNFAAMTAVGLLGGATVGPVATIGAFGAVEILGPVYRRQSAYNLKHGIRHDRRRRKNNGKS